MPSGRTALRLASSATTMAPSSATPPISSSAKRIWRNGAIAASCDCCTISCSDTALRPQGRAEREVLRALERREHRLATRGALRCRARQCRGACRLQRGDDAVVVGGFAEHETDIVPGQCRELLRQRLIERKAERHPGDGLRRTERRDHDLVRTTADDGEGRGVAVAIGQAQIAAGLFGQLPACWHSSPCHRARTARRGRPRRGAHDWRAPTAWWVDRKSRPPP